MIYILLNIFILKKLYKIFFISLMNSLQKKKKRDTAIKMMNISMIMKKKQKTEGGVGDMSHMNF